MEEVLGRKDGRLLKPLLSASFANIVFQCVGREKVNAGKLKLEEREASSRTVKYINEA